MSNIPPLNAFPNDGFYNTPQFWSNELKILSTTISQGDDAWEKSQEDMKENYVQS